MLNLTDRQRFALRESLCNEIESFSVRHTGDKWSEKAIPVCRVLTKVFDGVNYMPTFAVLVELLGEWPVGYRGEGGWERIECKS